MTINWGTSHFRISWWAGLIFYALILGLGIFIAFKCIKEKWVVCDKCGTRFKVKTLLSNNSNNGVIAKCPHCGERHECTVSYDQTE
ncbi:MAG: hypothetical protein MJ096_05725 [Clostridia bacterium]|nr:hypothetical protein [Clostridia bacterium]